MPYHLNVPDPTAHCAFNGRTIVRGLQSWPNNCWQVGCCVNYEMRRQGSSVELEDKDTRVWKWNVEVDRKWKVEVDRKWNVEEQRLWSMRQSSSHTTVIIRYSFMYIRKGVCSTPWQRNTNWLSVFSLRSLSAAHTWSSGIFFVFIRKIFNINKKYFSYIFHFWDIHEIY